MKILFIGDIFSSVGRRIVADHLQDIRETQSIDLAIANAENSAGGFGITPDIADELFSLGLDVLTSGNHIWDKREIYEYFARRPQLLRPANYPDGTPGAGVVKVKARNGVECAVINLQGRTYMPSSDCPFRPRQAWSRRWSMHSMASLSNRGRGPSAGLLCSRCFRS